MSTAENARSEPTSAPVCESAARAAASERPTLRQTTGLSASAQRAQRVDEGVGPAHGLQEEPDRASSRRSSAKKARKSAASVTASAPDETTQRSPMRPPSERNASAIEPDWQSTATCPGAVVSCGRPFQAAGPPGTKNPMQFGPSSAAPSSRARAASRSVDRLCSRAGLGADAGDDERAHARRRSLLEGSLDARRG